MSEELQQAIIRYLDMQRSMDVGLVAIAIICGLLVIGIAIVKTVYDCKRDDQYMKKYIEGKLYKVHNDEITKQILETNKDRIEEYKKKGIM